MNNLLNVKLNKKIKTKYMFFIRLPETLRKNIRQNQFQ